jgi:hypothetical protein
MDNSGGRIASALLVPRADRRLRREDLPQANFAAIFLSFEDKCLKPMA